MLLVELSPGRVDGDGDLTEKEIIRFERNSGVVSGRVREIQVSRTVQASSTLFFRSLCISVQKMVVFFSFAHGNVLKNCAQLQNYTRKMEQKMQREEDLRMGLRLYKSVN